MLLAEHTIRFFEVGLTVAGMIVPAAIFIFVKLAKLDTKLNNGLCNQIELLRLELVSHGKKIRNLEIANAKTDGGQSDIHGGT